MKSIQKLLPLTAALSVALLVSACGKSGTTAAPAESALAAESPAADAPAEATPAPAEAAPAGDATAATGDAADPGKKVYGATCALCHASGLAGAPKPGDKADWGPRIAQGKDMLYTHALEGYNGNAGAMPARGGNLNLSDDDVKAAVDYMVAQSQ